MTAHAFLPPSGASAWLRCAMWPTMNRLFPQDDSPASIEGTAAHWVGWEILAGRKPLEGSPAPNGCIVTEEMLEGGELLAETIAVKAMMLYSGGLHIEESLSVPIIHAECFGTPDAWSYDIAGEDLYIEIVDYKFGHRFVDEYMNAQGIVYLLGILSKLGYDGKIASSSRVHCSFTIVQPRCYYKGSSVRTHSFVINEALPIINRLKSAADAAYSAAPEAVTNECCSDCPGRHACGALQQAAYSAAEFATTGNPVVIEPAAAALELRILERSLDRLQARVDGLRELTLNNIRTGKSVPYYRVEQSKSRLRWNVPVEQVIALGELFGKDLAKPGVITPTQAKKVIDESVINNYAFVPTGELKLVAENTSDAQRVFGIKENF